MSDTASDAYTLPRVNGNLATVPARRPIPLSSTKTAPALENATPAPARPATQESLFAHKPVSKVIPFESFAPGRPEHSPRPVTAAPPRPAAPKTAAKSATAPKSPATRSGTRRGSSTQNSEIQSALDFLPAAPPSPRTLKTTVEAVIYCDAPVATPIHRLVASCVDISMVLIGFSLFLGAFYLGGGELELTPVTTGVLGAAFLLVSFFYGLLWMLARSETFGMRVLQLRLTNFDGFPPDPSQRLLRFAGTCLSFCAAGLGLLWALADEESLTWHDHISKTFPTVRTQATNFVRKR
ncbi:MAG TPA: RDD family protein [Bryobacteraceae bacterium]|nr:RDD family protein [Bryobacteraceae bacterium]